MKKLFVAAVMSTLQVSAAFAAGPSLGAVKVRAAAPVMAALPAAAKMSAGSVLPAFTGVALTHALPGLAVAPMAVSVPKLAPWVYYDTFVWPKQVEGYALFTAGYVRYGLQGSLAEAEGIAGCAANPDCGGTNHLVQAVFHIGSGVEQIIVGGLVIPRPGPHFPPFFNSLPLFNKVYNLVFASPTT